MKAKHSKSLGMKKGTDYTAGSSNVMKEAEEKKFGGKVVDKPEGKKSKARMDKRPRRAAGGRCGSDKSPFSSASSPKQNIDA